MMLSVSIGTGRQCLFATSLLGAPCASVTGGIDVFCMTGACCKDGQGGGGASHYIPICRDSLHWVLGMWLLKLTLSQKARLDGHNIPSCEVPKCLGDFQGVDNCIICYEDLLHTH